MRTSATLSSSSSSLSDPYNIVRQNNNDNSIWMMSMNSFHDENNKLFDHRQLQATIDQIINLNGTFTYPEVIFNSVSFRMHTHLDFSRRLK